MWLGHLQEPPRRPIHRQVSIPPNAAPTHRIVRVSGPALSSDSGAAQRGYSEPIVRRSAGCHATGASQRNGAVPPANARRNAMRPCTRSRPSSRTRLPAIAAELAHQLAAPRARASARRAGNSGAEHGDRAGGPRPSRAATPPAARPARWRARHRRARWARTTGNRACQPTTARVRLTTSLVDVTSPYSSRSARLPCRDRAGWQAA